jgi:hypothetical protein
MFPLPNNAFLAAWDKRLASLFACVCLVGCATVDKTNPAPKENLSVEIPAAESAEKPKVLKDDSEDPFRAYARKRVAEEWETVHPPSAEDAAAIAKSEAEFNAYTERRAEDTASAFFQGRYNRSRARLPENIEQWRSGPNIANPGPDLANFPNSAFTLPKGRAYIEISPFSYYGTALASPAQYNAEFLLRYGVTDSIELRLFGNGLSWSGGADSTWGFSPLAFDTKIQLWTEKPDYFLPAAGFEAYIQTTWLGSQSFNGGTQPSFTFNFDQSLPWKIDFEYNLGATRFQDLVGQNIWEFSFQWAFQREVFNKDFAVFIHGFYNAASLPRIPNTQLPNSVYKAPTQNAVGGGFIWTVNPRLAVYGQVSGGATRFTPSIISLLGLAVSF